jgi:hypothetical protein
MNAGYIDNSERILICILIRYALNKLQNSAGAHFQAIGGLM